MSCYCASTQLLGGCLFLARDTFGHGGIVSKVRFRRPYEDASGE